MAVTSVRNNATVNQGKNPSQILADSIPSELLQNDMAQDEESWVCLLKWFPLQGNKQRQAARGQPGDRNKFSTNAGTPVSIQNKSYWKSCCKLPSEQRYYWERSHVEINTCLSLCIPNKVHQNRKLPLFANGSLFLRPGWQSKWIILQEFVSQTSEH